MEIWSNKWFQEAKTEKLIQLVKDRIARNDLVQKTKTHVGLQCLSVIQSIASTMLIPTLYQFESPHGALTTGQTTDQDADNSMKYIINVPLFYHVSAVVKLSIKQQRTLGERLFVELQPAGPATDRPSDHLNTGVLASSVSHTHDVWCKRFQAATECFSCFPPDLNLSKLSCLASNLKEFRNYAPQHERETKILRPLLQATANTTLTSSSTF